MLGELEAVFFGKTENDFTRLFEYFLAKFGVTANFVDKFLGILRT